MTKSLTALEIEKEQIAKLHEKSLTALRNLFTAQKQQFFEYAWRQNIEGFLSSESKYSILLDWINNKRNESEIIINTFNPADKDEHYTKLYFKNYIDCLRDYALLTDCYEIMINKCCTVEMRENIEYTLCKFFNIHYNDLLKTYCANGE